LVLKERRPKGGSKYGNLYNISLGETHIFWGAVLILSKARGRHFSQGRLVSGTNLVNCLFKV
jgi:hypothetical protein